MRAALTGLVLLAGVQLVASASASACSRLVDLDVYAPADGADAVPTNVVPWLAGFVGSGDADVQLFDSTGSLVPAELHRVGVAATGGEHFELRPNDTLRPNETYRIAIALEDGLDDEHTFTTGDGPIEGPPPPLGDLRMQTADNLMSSCGDTGTACVNLPDGQMVDIEMSWEGGSSRGIARSWERSLGVLLPQLAAEVPFCLEIRPRDMAGQLGEPTTLCSNDWPLFDVHITSGPIYCRDGRLFAEGDFIDQTHDPVGSGCSVAPGIRSPATAAGLAFLVLVLLSRRRCRRRPLTS